MFFSCTFIDSNTIIRSGVTIGDDAFVGANCIIGEYLMNFCLDKQHHEHLLAIDNKALIRSGSIIYAEGKFYETPAYAPRKLVDATGCGDTYSAGYLYARAKGMSYEESGRFAAAMCTLKLEHTGPFDRTIDDVHDVLSR